MTKARTSAARSARMSSPSGAACSANNADLLVEKGGAYYCFCQKSDEEPVERGQGDQKARLRLPRPSARREAKAPRRSRGAICRPAAHRTRAAPRSTTPPSATLRSKIRRWRIRSSLKSDGLPTYNFANVVDDHLMGITHVVRGSEYLSSAPKYNLLYEAFGWEVPTYVHCSPVMRDAQHKMSKRNGDPSYEDLICDGYLTEAVLNYVALLGWSPKGELAEREFFTLQELAEVFDLSPASRNLRRSSTSTSSAG